MKNKTGLTLMEMTLTITLVSILLTALFGLTDMQRDVVRRLQHNTSALYLLESIRNHIRYELSQGLTIDELNTDNFQFTRSSDWKIALDRQPESGRVLVSLQHLRGGRFGTIYRMEVTAR